MTAIIVFVVVVGEVVVVVVSDCELEKGMCGNGREKKNKNYS
jgi:hypothetical protein